MKYKCKCPPDSPFHWRDNPRSSMFVRDTLFTAGARQSQSQTMVIERAREKGKDISHFPGMSEKAAKTLRINVKEFNIFSRAGYKL